MKKPIVVMIFFLIIVSALLTYQRPEKDKSLLPLRETSSSKGIEETTVVSYIQPADLSDETKRIVSALGFEDLGIFDVVSHEPSVMMKVWVEVFENGERQEDILNFSSSRPTELKDSVKKSQVILSTKVKEDSERNERTYSFLASIVDEGGASSSSNELTLKGKWGGRLSSPLNTREELQLGRPVTVLTVVESNGDHISFSTSETNQYDETGEVPEEILSYDRVLLYRVMLEKE